MCLLAFAGSLVPLPSMASPAFSDLPSARAMALLNGQSCAQRARFADDVAQATPSPAPSPSPSPGATPTVPPAPSGPSQLYATPYPQHSSPSPPPVPTPTPVGKSSSGPIVLIAPSGAPPSIAPVGSGETPSPATSPVAEGPTPLPTLEPGYVAALADKVVGNTNDGRPADLYGHVSIFYSDEVIVGDHAHWDGHQYLTLSGNPYIVNREKNSVLYADLITFDALAQTAKLTQGRGVSSQGVEKGLVHFSAAHLETDSAGVAHGTDASLTTCERPRSGYHITGRTIDVKPGDKITITKAVLFLGAAAVFYLPKVVIPLRTIDDERRRPSFFPEVGYDQLEGFWVKARLGFGADQYYYGYYRVEFFTKVGLGLGYVGAYQAKNGRRSANVNYYGIHDRRTQTTTSNLQAQEQENFARTVRGNFALSYNSNFGPLTNLPPNTSLSGTVAHAGARESQTYTYSRAAVGTQSNTNDFGFTDSHTFTDKLQNTLAVSYSNSSATYGGFFSSNSLGHFNNLTHWSSRSADYQLTFDKTFSKTPYGYNKEPELQIRPYTFLQHFFFPVSSSFTIGRYNEPQNGFTTSRAALSLIMGPALYRIFSSDFSATVNLNQYAYGTGDLKAAIQQNLSLTTPIGNHFVNNINYSSSAYNGPASVPFQTLDQQPTTNFKNAQDTMRIFNNDVYNLTLGFSTAFDRQAFPVQYQLTARPSPRSFVQLGGSFVPGSGRGFDATNVQFITPFGNGGQIQFSGIVDWKAHGRLENKNIYYSRIIGDCYEVRVQYNQSLRQVNVTLDLLAFPSRAASFGIGNTGPIFPSSINF